MLKALYDFKSIHPKTLSFSESDLFYLLSSHTKEKNSWWLVANSHGVVGYIPTNYITHAAATSQERIKFADSCVKAVHLAHQGQTLPKDKLELVQKLMEVRRQAMEENPNGNNSRRSSEDSAGPSTPRSHGSSKAVVAFPTPTSSKPSSRRSSGQEETSPSVIASELVESVRQTSQLSHYSSQKVVQLVVRRLQTHLSLGGDLTSVLDHLSAPLAMGKGAIERSHDARRLRVIFEELASCKDDEQQRSWMLHEDEHIIIEYLQELIAILSNADPRVCRHVASRGNYQWVNSLLLYYQMEARWSIRQLMLQAFGALCGLDAPLQTVILNSVLPMEVARDMQSYPRDIDRQCYSGLLLTMVLSMGETMPITHLDQLGESFLRFLLDGIETPPREDVNEQIPDLYLNLLLSYNLQFRSPEDNVLLRVLSANPQAKTFTEKALVLFNREEDPVRVFTHEPAPPHSVVKLFTDLFHWASTALLFYTNDVKVLIDIIIRQLSDLSPGEQRRSHYLQLCQRVLRNSSFSEHRHRKEDLLKCFTSILCEEGTSSRQDQNVVKEIFNEFPLYFKVVANTC